MYQRFAWLDDELLKSILVADDEGDANHQSFVIHSAIVRDALAVGENFGSEMLRLTIVYGENAVAERRSRSVIVKALAAHQSMADEMGLFCREITAYEHVIPRAEAKLRSIGDFTQFAAR